MVRFFTSFFNGLLLFHSIGTAGKICLIIDIMLNRIAFLQCLRGFLCSFVVCRLQHSNNSAPTITAINMFNLYGQKWLIFGVLVDFLKFFLMC